MKKYILARLAVMTVCCMSLSACGKSAKQLNNTGIEYFNSSQYEKAVDTFRQAAEKDKDGSAEYYDNLGKAYIELGQYQNAEDAFLSALGNVDDDKTALWGMGVALYYTGDYASSMEYFRKIVDNIASYDDTDIDALQYYASLQSYYNDCAGAIDSYTVLIRKKHNVAQQYFLRGSLYAAQKMENEAVLDYEEALKEYGDDYEIYYNIYYGLHQAGFEDRAVSYLRRALELDCADNLLKGRTYYIINDYENAQKYLSKAIDDGSQEAEFYLAMTYDKLGKGEEAVELYSSYIKNYPSDAKAYNQYGMYFMNKGDYSSALEYFSAGLALGSDEAERELMFNQACCYEYLHQYTMAYDKFGEYLKVYPDDANAQHEYDFLSSR